MMTVETPLMNCHAQPHHPARPVSLMSLDAPQVTVVSPKASAVHFMKEKPKKLQTTTVTLFRYAKICNKMNMLTIYSFQHSIVTRSWTVLTG